MTAIHIYLIVSDGLGVAFQQLAGATSLTLAVAIYRAVLAAQFPVYAARRQFKVLRIVGSLISGTPGYTPLQPSTSWEAQSAPMKSQQRMGMQMERCRPLRNHYLEVIRPSRLT